MDPHVSLDSQSTPSTLSRLERLPSELFSMLIDYAPEKIGTLRLASGTVNWRVEEYLSQRGNVQILDQVVINSWLFENKKSTPGNLHLSLYFQPLRLTLFKMRLLRQNPHRAIVERIKQLKDGGSGCRFYTFEFVPGKDSDSVLQLMKDMFGSRIGKGVRIRCDRSTPLHYVAKYLDGMLYGLLEVETKDLSENAVKHLLDPIRKHRVHHLALSVEKVTVADPVALLKELSTVVRSLRINQKPLSGIHAYPGRTYLFGVSGLDWAPIIVEMFSGKLDKMWIMNTEYPNFIPLQYYQHNGLINDLINLGKPLWFDSQRSVRFTTDPPPAQENGDYVFGVSTTGLRVQHHSRIHESFDTIFSL